MELQERAQDFERAGIAVFAISYDPVAVLEAFASKRGITYQLLSDEGSRVIRDLGLYNDHLEAQHAQNGVRTRPEQMGVAYPGIFVLDEHGVIVDKLFEQRYRVRPTAAALLGTASTVAASEAVVARGRTDQIDIVASLDTPTYRPYQKLALKVHVAIADGLHVYGSPIPDGYTALTFGVESTVPIEVGPYDLPAAKPFQIEGLDEQFVVYQGTVEAVIPCLILQNHGDVDVTVRAQYQACSESVCFPPTDVVLHLTVKGLDNIRD